MWRVEMRTHVGGRRIKMGKSEARILVSTLKDQGLTVAVAESLTGGEVCSRIVDISGASQVLRGAIVAYATELKRTLLGVDASLLASGGPVQAQVAIQMAQGVARECQADVGIATTGVAGPGDSPDGPEGLVYVAAWTSSGTLVRELHLEGGRKRIRAHASEVVLRLATEAIKRV